MPARIVAALLAASLGGQAFGEVLSFDLPSDDRWFYPFNFSPGTRPLASCFSAAGLPFFNDRDGEFLIGWDTTGLIPAGQGSETYAIKSITITLTGQPGGEWLVDLTPDEWFTFDINQDEVINGDGVARGLPGDTDGESDDLDPGRTMELFGVGFGPTYTYDSWNEYSIYIGSSSTSNKARDPFPFVYQDDTLALLHVEDSVKGLFNESLPEPVLSFTPTPWAIGVPQDYTPGNQDVPYQVVFELDLELSGGAVREYFQNQLDGGRLIVDVTSMTESSIFAPDAGYPVFYTKEGLSLDPDAAAPLLEITFCEAGQGDADADCDVDLFDFESFQGCFSGPGIVQSEPSCLFADLDGDGDVDLLDFGGVQQRFTGAK